jgi:acetolactate synthase I/II/III large subunit
VSSTTPAAPTTRVTGAEAIAAELTRHGVRHVFGVGGANIEDLFLAVQRRRPQIMAILGKHEYSAGTAADAYSRISRSLGVVMTTSGGGAMNLVPALAESFASRVPVLAIVGEPPTTLQGRGAFQDTSGRGRSVDAQTVFRGVSASCERANRPEDLPLLLQAAVRMALDRSAPTVLLVAKDLQQAPLGDGVPTGPAQLVQAHVSAPDPGIIDKARQVLTDGPVAIVAGDEIARHGAQQELARLAVLLDATVAVTPDARDAFDNRDARFAGVTGAMGHESAAQAIANARACLLVGTRLPLLARQGYEAILEAKPIVCIAREAPFIASHYLHLGGDLRGNIRALSSALEGGPDVPRHGPMPLPRRADVEGPIEFEAMEHGSVEILRTVERTLPQDGVVLVDAGNTGAHAVHYLRAPRKGHWLVAMGMAGMGYTFGAAIGAAFATGTRTVVLAGDGAFFMHGLEIHTAVQHWLPITYVIFNNRAHGMCLLRERLLLGEESGYNVFRESNIGEGLAAMFPGLAASDCRTTADLEHGLAHVMNQPGPSVLCAHLPGVDVPPFAAFRSALAAGRAAERTATA